MVPTESTGMVLVVQSHRALGEALSRLLAASGVQAHAASFEAVESTAARIRPSLLVLDGDAPPERLDAAVAQVRRYVEEVRVILVRGRDRRLGKGGPAADGVVSLNAGAEQLAVAVDRVLSGHAEPPRAASDSSTSVDNAGPGSGLDALTGRERDVLAILMTGSTREAIAAQLGISPHTVRTHLQNMFSKLGVGSRTEAAVIGIRAGLRPARTMAEQEVRP